MSAKKEPFGIAIVGCGLIGQKREAALGNGGHLVATADIVKARAENLADAEGGKAFSDWQKAIILPEVDIVVISNLTTCCVRITRVAIE